MKEQFIVARNAFTVTAPDGLSAWTELQPRFRLFAAQIEDKPILEVNIISGKLPECDGERIYEPEHAKVGFITSRAYRHQNGSLIMEFTHIEETKPRLWMKMPPELNKADIIICPMGDECDSYFLTHALMIAYMLSTCGNGTLLIHSSAVIYDGKAYLFQGKSGTGKSTHVRLWIKNIEGAERLNDDHPIVRFSEDGEAIAYGSPWSGKVHCYRNISAPVGAFVRIVRDEENALHRLSPLKAYASLTASVFFLPFLSDELRTVRHKTIERLVATATCCEMHCRPDADAALTCRRELSTYGAESSGFPNESTK